MSTPKAMPIPGLCLLVCMLAASLLPRMAACADDPGPGGHSDLHLTFEHSRGQYGESSTTRIDNATIVGRHRGEGWLAEIQLPFLEVRSDAGNGGLPDTVGKGGRVERGLGDLYLLLSGELRPFTPESTGIDLTVKIKTKTGNVDRGLGTGGTDVAAQIEWLRSIGPLVAFGHIGYRRTGDVAGFPRYRDPWYGELGAYTRVSNAIEAGAYYDMRQAIGRLGPLRELTAYAGWRVDDYKLQAYVTRGFARASPDWALGIVARRRF